MNGAAGYVGRAFGIASTVLCAACSAAHHAATPAATSVPQRRLPALATAALEPTALRWLPQWESRERPTIVDTEPDGTIDLTLGDLRAQVSGDRVTWARDVPRTPIRRAVHVADGWIFESWFGVTSSGTFLGPLRSIDAVRRPAFEGRDRGRFAQVDERGRLWSTARVDVPLARMDTPVARIEWGAFLDRDRGVIMSAFGSVFTTRDGGERWDPVPARGSYVVGLLWTAAGVAVETADGAAHAIPGFAEAPLLQTDSDDALWARLERSVIEQHPEWLATLYSGAYLELTGGARFAARGDDLLLWRRGHDVPVAVRGLPHGCDFCAWGADSIAVWCGDDSFYRISDDGQAHRVGPAEAASTGADVGYLTGSACGSPSGTGNFDDTWNHGGLRCYRSWIEQRGVNIRVRPHEYPFVLDRSVVHVVQDHLLRGSLDAPDAQEARIDFPRAPDGSPVELTDYPHVTDDGLLTARVAPPRANQVTAMSPYQLLGPPDHLRLVRLPDGARGVDFLDGRRGVASGLNFSALWVTNDGGAHWRSVDVGLDEPETSTSPDDATRLEVKCGDGRCLVSNQLEVRSFEGGPARWTGLTVHSAPPDPGPTPERVTPSLADAPLACTASSSPSTPADAGGLAGADLALEVTRRRGPRGAVSLAWYGRDAAGPIRGATAAATLPPARVPAERRDEPLDPAEWTYTPLVVTRRGVLFERYSFTPMPQRDVIWAAQNGRATVVAHAGNQENGGEPVLIPAASALPDGGAAVVWAENVGLTRRATADAIGSVGDAPLALLVATRVAPNGATESSETVPLFGFGAPFIALVQTGHAVGLAVGDHSDPSSLAVHWTGPTRRTTGSVSIPPFDAVAPCHEPTREGTTVLTFPLSRHAFEPSQVETELNSLFTASLEIPPAGPCLRSLQTHQMEQSVDPHGTDAVVSLQAAADGSLRGTIVDGARVQSVTCTVTAARRPH